MPKKSQLSNELKQLGLYINNELQRDFFSDSSLYDEDIENLHWTIEDSLLDDVVEEELTEHISQSTPSNQTDFSYSEIEGQQLKLLF